MEKQEGALQIGLPPSTPWGLCSPSPQFLQKISDPKLRAWGGQLHELWKRLGKKVSTSWALAGGWSKEGQGDASLGPTLSFEHRLGPHHRVLEWSSLERISGEGDMNIYF